MYVCVYALQYMHARTHAARNDYAHDRSEQRKEGVEILYIIGILSAPLSPRWTSAQRRMGGVVKHKPSRSLPVCKSHFGLRPSPYACCLLCLPARLLQYSTLHSASV